MPENLLDNVRIFNAGNDAHRTATGRARLGIDPKYLGERQLFAGSSGSPNGCFRGSLPSGTQIQMADGLIVRSNKRLPDRMRT